jgi:AcrR family transcriptional regulator
MNLDREKIIMFCQELFLKEGFYKISMDEIASDLKMSKKTIYKYFPSKQDLVRIVILDFLKTNQENIKEIVNQKQDAVTKFHLMVKFIAEMLLRGGEKLFIEIPKHMPEMWNEIDSFRTKMMGEKFSMLIEQGKKEKYFIDIPTILVINIFISAVRGVVTPRFLMNNKFSATEALNYTIKILMNGILTEKGLKIFNRLNLGD